MIYCSPDNKSRSGLEQGQKYNNTITGEYNNTITGEYNNTITGEYNNTISGEFYLSPEKLYIFLHKNKKS